MNARRTLTLASLLLATTLAATQAQAAAAAAGPAAAAAAAGAAAPAPPTGPPIAGVCAFSYDRTLADSAVGRAFQARMQQLTAQVQAELQPQGTQLQTDANALQGQRATLAADAFQQRADQLNTRINAFSQLQEQRTQELEATRQQQLQRIVQSVNPIVVQVYNTRRCSVVFDAQALIAINPAMDISDDVVRQLNTTMSTITFDRVRADAAGAAAPAAAPAAAAPRR